MSVESSRVKTEVWTDWEGQVVNGVYPLHRFLGASSHGAVFLTEYKAENLRPAAIKLVPADTSQRDAQLVQWGAAATRSHPQLIRLFDVGRGQLGRQGLLFVVMEHAEQTLAQVLLRRALSMEEVRELLPPSLEALAFLHRNQLVHGQLKPANFLVVNDRLKLASDTVRAAGHSSGGGVRTSPYDPPELSAGRVSAAGDIWALGTTLAEALTQRTPAWPDERAEIPTLPATVPEQFADMVRRCLSRAPANRPSLIELGTQCTAAPAPPSAAPAPLPQQVEGQIQREAAPAPQSAIPTPAPRQVTRQTPRESAPAQRVPGTHRLLPGIATALAVLLAVWLGLRLSHTRPQPVVNTAAPAAVSAAAQPEKSALQLSGPASTLEPQPSVTAASATPVLHRELPDIPPNIRQRIRGRINVGVRVLVDPAGNVVGEFLESAGPSRYFARLAGDAAGAWKFAPTDNRGPQVWLLQFGFTRDGATVEARSR